MLKTIYFDLGNVLFFFSHQKMLDQIAACSGLTSEQVKRILFEHHHLQEAYETGQMDSAEIYRFFKSRAKKDFSLHEFIDAVSDIFTPNQDIWPLIEQLKEAGKRLIIISNTCESHYNKVYSFYPILRLFDHKVLSFEVGSLKPEPKIFQKALAHSRCAVSECFFTDDIPAYVAAARREGIDSELFTDVPTLKEHLAARGCSLG